MTSPSASDDQRPGHAAGDRLVPVGVAAEHVVTVELEAGAVVEDQEAEHRTGPLHPGRLVLHHVDAADAAVAGLGVVEVALLAADAPDLDGGGLGRRRHAGGAATGGGLRAAGAGRPGRRHGRLGRPAWAGLPPSGPRRRPEPGRRGRGHRRQRAAAMAGAMPRSATAPRRRRPPRRPGGRGGGRRASPSSPPTSSEAKPSGTRTLQPSGSRPVRRSTGSPPAMATAASPAANTPSLSPTSATMANEGTPGPAAARTLRGARPPAPSGTRPAAGRRPPGRRRPSPAKGTTRTASGSRATMPSPGRTPIRTSSSFTGCVLPGIASARRGPASAPGRTGRSPARWWRSVGRRFPRRPEPTW